MSGKRLRAAASFMLYLTPSAAKALESLWKREQSRNPERRVTKSEVIRELIVSEMALDPR
jgi:hypothetical protein